MASALAACPGRGTGHAKPATPSHTHASEQAAAQGARAAMAHALQALHAIQRCESADQASGLEGLATEGSAPAGRQPSAAGTDQAMLASVGSQAACDPTPLGASASGSSAVACNGGMSAAACTSEPHASCVLAQPSCSPPLAGCGSSASPSLRRSRASGKPKEDLPAVHAVSADSSSNQPQPSAASNALPLKRCSSGKEAACAEPGQPASPASYPHLEALLPLLKRDDDDRMTVSGIYGPYEGLLAFVLSFASHLQDGPDALPHLPPDSSAPADPAASATLGWELKLLSLFERWLGAGVTGLSTAWTLTSRSPDACGYPVLPPAPLAVHLLLAMLKHIPACQTRAASLMQATLSLAYKKALLAAQRFRQGGDAEEAVVCDVAEEAHVELLCLTFRFISDVIMRKRVWQTWRTCSRLVYALQNSLMDTSGLSVACRTQAVQLLCLEGSTSAVITRLLAMKMGSDWPDLGAVLLASLLRPLDLGRGAHKARQALLDCLMEDAQGLVENLVELITLPWEVDGKGVMVRRVRLNTEPWEAACILAEDRRPWPALRKGRTLYTALVTLDALPNIPRMCCPVLRLLAKLGADPQAFELYEDYDEDSREEIVDGLLAMFDLLHSVNAEQRELAELALTSLLEHHAPVHKMLGFYEHAGSDALLKAWRVKNWPLRSSLLTVLSMLFTQDVDSLSVEPSQWPILSTIFADVRAEPDCLGLAAVASMADIANAAAMSGVDVLVAMRFAGAHRHLAVILLHTLAKLPWPRARLEAFNCEVGICVSSLAASLVSLAEEADYQDPASEVAAAATAVAEALLGPANPPSAPADAAAGAAQPRDTGAFCIANAADHAIVERMLQTSGVISILSHCFNVCPAITRRFQVNDCIYDLIALGTKAMSLTSRANNPTATSITGVRVAVYSCMTVTTSMLKAARQRNAAASPQLPAGRDLRVVHDVFAIVSAEMGENIGSSTWEHMLIIACSFVGTHLLSAGPTTLGWQDCLASLCMLLAHLLTSGPRKLASFRANHPDEAQECFLCLRSMLDRLRLILETVVAHAGIDACRGCLPPIACALVGLERRMRDRLLGKDAAARLQALVSQSNEQAEAAATAAAEALLAEEASLSVKTEATKAKKKKAKAKAKKGKQAAVDKTAAGDAENVQSPNGDSAAADPDMTARPDSAVPLWPDDAKAATSLVPPLPAGADGLSASKACSMHAESAEPAQHPRGTSRQRTQQLVAQPQAGDPPATSTVARALDEAAVCHSETTHDAVGNPATHHCSSAEIAVQHAQSVGALTHQQHPRPCVLPPEGAAAGELSLAREGPALPAVQPPQTDARSRGRRQQRVPPTGTKPVANVATGAALAAVTAGQHGGGAAVDAGCKHEVNSKLAALMRQLLPGAMHTGDPRTPEAQAQRAPRIISASSLLQQQPNRAPSYMPPQHWNPQGMQAPVPGTATAQPGRSQPAEPAMQLQDGALPATGLPIPGLVVTAAAPAVHGQEAAKDGSAYEQREPRMGQALPMQAAALHMVEMDCPITQDVMHDPVIAADGHTYERSAIEQWLSNHDTSPMTNERLFDKTLIGNVLVRRFIQSYWGSTASIKQG